MADWSWWTQSPCDTTRCSSSPPSVDTDLARNASDYRAVREGSWIEQVSGAASMQDLSSSLGILKKYKQTKLRSILYTWSSISVMEDEACHKHVVLRDEWWPRCERAREQKHRLAFHAAISGRPRKKQWHRKVRLCCHFVRVIRYYFCSSVTGSV